MPFGQFAATSQFYLYGTQYCTRTGWEKASNKYLQPDELTTLDLADRVFIITGANSGIGFECASHLAKNNATVYMVCRNPDRAEDAKTKIMESSNNDKVFVILGDCSLQSGVEKIWQDFVAHRRSVGAPEDSIRLDALLCNAGGLNNEPAPNLTSEGIETTFGAHLLFGTYHLVKLALSTLENTPDSRVIVVSSGGMYNTKFPSWNRAAARRGKFDGQFAYAYAKRGQVLLCEEWSKKFPSVKFASCHPGKLMKELMTFHPTLCAVFSAWMCSHIHLYSDLPNTHPTSLSGSLLFCICPSVCLYVYSQDGWTHLAWMRRMGPTSPTWSLCATSGRARRAFSGC